ncbi:hypothetical protein M501DRAFT_998964 [Patellaria atrata CBS 101060]|uniref:Ubiquitin-conjugating enzyme E2C-binding protein n=1 Tax=Patellaria atrata CBS 101060 TaxID=1346257 RepID=A0A9P4S3Q4_9PEZI|nr:hypothetical protein M501DRAFT_998964 [Patellaria atrata CBS 101060]
MGESESDADSHIELYAELLLNIRTISFFASLRTESNEETKASLSTDGEWITLTHEGKFASIRLPTKISGGGSASLTLPATPSKELTLRLQLEEKAAGLLQYGEASADEGANAVPWSATSMDDAKRISCLECSNELVKSDAIGQWKDLPSENWAEMMDFWHCHKPHEHQHHTVGQEKGYAASTELTASQGTGLVDLSYLLLDHEDCSGVKEQIIQKSSSSHNHNHDPLLLCSSCNSVLGLFDTRAEGYKLYKWSLTIAFAKPRRQYYSMQKWLSALFITLVESQGVRKFRVDSSDRDDDAEKESLLIWIFTPSLLICSSVLSSKRTDPTRAMKIFWQTEGRKEAPTALLMDTQSMSVEELTLPALVVTQLRDTLRESAKLLPISARRFQGWDVGLLERFRGDEKS